MSAPESDAPPDRIQGAIVELMEVTDDLTRSTRVLLEGFVSDREAFLKTIRGLDAFVETARMVIDRIDRRIGRM